MAEMKASECSEVMSDRDDHMDVVDNNFVSEQKSNQTTDDKCGCYDEDDISLDDSPVTTDGVTTGEAAAESEEPTMSKRKRKRLAQKLKKQQYLQEKRLKERLRKKERLREARAQGLSIGPSRKALKHNTMAKSSCKVNVVIDCSFDHLMEEKDSKSIVKQINFCYAANRRAADPVQFHVTSFVGKVQHFMSNIGDYQKWDVHVHEQSFLEVFDKKDVVYLSSDSKNVLQTLDNDKIYIIGGLVDHNHHKGHCLQLAEERGLRHAQLPINNFVALESRTTLAVNHVFEILVRYTESRDWKDAFYKVIPKRKVAENDDTDSLSKTDTATVNGTKLATDNVTLVDNNVTSNSVTSSGDDIVLMSENVVGSVTKRTDDNAVENAAGESLDETTDGSENLTGTFNIMQHSQSAGQHSETRPDTSQANVDVSRVSESVVTSPMQTDFKTCHSKTITQTSTSTS